jgi:hypothetical protein
MTGRRAKPLAAVTPTGLVDPERDRGTVTVAKTLTDALTRTDTMTSSPGLEGPYS